MQVGCLQAGGCTSEALYLLAVDLTAVLIPGHRQPGWPCPVTHPADPVWVACPVLHLWIPGCTTAGNVVVSDS